MSAQEGDVLASAIALYVRAAMPIVHANLQQGELIAWPTGRWTSQGGHYQRQEGQRTSWARAIDHRQAQLRALPEYQNIISVIRSNPDWNTQFDTLVGIPWMRWRLGLAQFIDECLGAALAAEPEGGDPAGAAIAHAAEVEAFLESPDVAIMTLAPLLGMDSGGFGRVELGPEVVIEPVDEEELERLYTAGLLTPPFPRWPFFVPPSHTIRVTFRYAKALGDFDETQSLKPEQQPGMRADGVIEGAVACLRLFRPGLVAAGARASTMPGPFPGYQHYGGSIHPVLGGQRFSVAGPDAYRLVSGDEDDLRALWSGMQSDGFKQSKQLALAVRRFAYKGERSRVDDQLVDLMVAAEALFLGDSDQEWRGELRYRLSLRAAWYIADSGRNRRTIFELFMAAYRMRSQLVHGTEAKPMKVAGETLTPERMVQVIEDLLRMALKQAVDESSRSSRAWTVDWDGLLFPVAPSPTVEGGAPAS